MMAPRIPREGESYSLGYKLTPHYFEPEKLHQIASRCFHGPTLGNRGFASRIPRGARVPRRPR